MRKCSRCKIEKDESLFNKNSKRKDGLQIRCKECNKEVLKKHYYDNESYYRTKNDKRKRNIKDYINSKKTSCTKCGESHIACLDFHHLSDKEIDIAAITNYMWSKNKIDKELSKCIVLCSNCHRKLHWEEKQSFVV